MALVICKGYLDGDARLGSVEEYFDDVGEEEPAVETDMEEETLGVDVEDRILSVVDGSDVGWLLENETENKT